MRQTDSQIVTLLSMKNAEKEGTEGSFGEEGESCRYLNRPLPSQKRLAAPRTRNQLR